MSLETLNLLSDATGLTIYCLIHERFQLFPKKCGSCFGGCISLATRSPILYPNGRAINLFGCFLWPSSAFCSLSIWRMSRWNWKKLWLFLLFRMFKCLHPLMSHVSTVSHLSLLSQLRNSSYQILLELTNFLLRDEMY